VRKEVEQVKLGYCKQRDMNTCCRTTNVATLESVRCGNSSTVETLDLLLDFGVLDRVVGAIGFLDGPVFL
jgi:hypothetical protein